MKINIFYNTAMPRYYKITSKYKEAALEALGETAGQKGEISIIFVNEKEILKINKQFLNHNYVTDVISFNYPFTREEGIPFGDVFVCFGQAKKQAKEQGRSALFEMLVLALHGTLHLIGYEDDTPRKRDTMNARAERFARKYL